MKTTHALGSWELCYVKEPSKTPSCGAGWKNFDESCNSRHIELIPCDRILNLRLNDYIKDITTALKNATDD